MSEVVWPGQTSVSGLQPYVSYGSSPFGGAGDQCRHDLERGEHHLTLNKLETIVEKLGIKLKDIFPNEF